MNETITDTRITEFCQKLTQLDAGAKARLKRNVGRTLAESHQVIGLFLNRLLPYATPTYQQDTYFLVATLYPLNPEAGGSGSLGTALNRAKDSDSLDRRVQVLLDADAAHLPFRLRQMVRFLYSKRVPVHWPLLLRDVLAWHSEKRWVQERWARDYYVGRRQAESEV